MRRTASIAAMALLAAATMIPTFRAAAEPAARVHRYVVLYEDGVSSADARAALADLGAKVVRENTAVGLTTVKTKVRSFREEAMETGLFRGVARDRAVGRTPTQRDIPVGRALEIPGFIRLDEGSGRRARERAPNGADPLYRYQWNLNMVDADLAGSYSVERGDDRVLVAILDSGIDARHKDIRRNLDRGLTRNFTRDIRVIDGLCRRERDGSCRDTRFRDPNGHGTQVASYVASPLNGFGLSGVAPEVSLVSLRVGQDSGFVFLQAVVDALTFAADNGVDIANLSFWIDPWFMNCADNPEDTPAEQLEQRTIVAAVQAAVDYARDRNVTVIASEGNDFMDLGAPRSPDEVSPTLPLGASSERTVDNDCLLMPQEADGVINVSGLGPSGRKAYYSTYGMERTDVAAPSGDNFDDAVSYPYNLLLGAISRRPLKDYNLIDRRGKPRVPDVLRRCHRHRCHYYMLNAGTSFASPIASGVAALIVSRFGMDDGAGGLTMDPADVESILLASAEPHACPDGGVQEYPEIGDSLEPFGITTDDLRATCEEGADGVNGFYGHGIVNAYNAVTAQP
ncbi:MAG: S8 family peptidase [Actinomycetota bacterium]